MPRLPTQQALQSHALGTRTLARTLPPQEARSPSSFGDTGRSCGRSRNDPNRRTRLGVRGGTARWAFFDVPDLLVLIVVNAS